jgi:non-heme chloroperoxidase
LPPAMFSLCWAAAYTGWASLPRGQAGLGVMAARLALPYPWSSTLQIASGMAPAIAFVWLGLLFYLVLRADRLAELSVPHFVAGVSGSLSVFLLMTLVSLNHFRHPQLDLHVMARSDFYSVFHVLVFNVPVGLTLITALLFTATADPRGGRRRPAIQSQQGPRRAGVVRGAMELLGVALCFPAACYAQAQAANPPKVQFVTVAPDVRLEVLDWGGTGRPLVFLAGLGNDAHIFDGFAPQFCAQNHVYAITRRGFGSSSKPDPTVANYSADRLGDDVLAVMDALHLRRPVLVGHSIAGEELSSVGTRHPERVAGLIYLDAAYGYAFYDSEHGEILFDFLQLKRELDEFTAGEVRDQRTYMHDLLSTATQFQRELDEAAQRDPSVPELHAPPRPTPPIPLAINFGASRYTSIPVPILAVFACPHDFTFDPTLRNDPKAMARVVGADALLTSRQADAFAAHVPSAHVVRIANADHYVFRSNGPEVVREMNGFLARLPE